MAEFQWWLLLVGLVAGGGLVAVVLLDGDRRDQDIRSAELPAEATWISDRLAPTEPAITPGAVEAVLRAHREYLQLPPPDEILLPEPTVTVDRPAGIAPAPRMEPEPTHPVEPPTD